MNTEIPHLAFGNLAALRNDAGSAPVALVQIAQDLAQAYRWRASSSKADDGRHVLRPTSVDARDPGRWELEETISLERGESSAVLLQAVPIAGDRAIVAFFPDWEVLNVTVESDGSRKLWLVRRLHGA